MTHASSQGLEQASLEAGCNVHRRKSFAEFSEGVNPGKMIFRNALVTPRPLSGGLFSSGPFVLPLNKLFGCTTKKIAGGHPLQGCEPCCHQPHMQLCLHMGPVKDVSPGKQARRGGEGVSGTFGPRSSGRRSFAGPLRGGP